MRVFPVMMLLFATFVFGGCTYSSTYSCRIFGPGKRSDFYPPMTWDFREQAWRQDFAVRDSVTRTGVYPPGYSVLNDGGHWGVVSDFIEGFAHLPTFWLEAAMYKSSETTYDVVFLDRNSTTGQVERLEIPRDELSRQPLEHPVFRDCLTNTMVRVNARDRPVLWWKDAFGVKTLLVYQAVYAPPQGESGGENLTGHRLLVFRDSVFERAYDLDRRRFETYQYDFQTQDGRFVTIASNSCTGWVFRQIDLKMGTVRDVGDFDAIARGGKSGGLELRVVERK